LISLPFTFPAKIFRSSLGFGKGYYKARCVQPSSRLRHPQGSLPIRLISVDVPKALTRRNRPGRLVVFLPPEEASTVEVNETGWLVWSSSWIAGISAVVVLIRSIT
jgi:hypothetical protein